MLGVNSDGSLYGLEEDSPSLQSEQHINHQDSGFPHFPESAPLSPSTFGIAVPNRLQTAASVASTFDLNLAEGISFGQLAEYEPSYLGASASQEQSIAHSPAYYNQHHSQHHPTSTVNPPPPLQRFPGRDTGAGSLMTVDPRHLSIFTSEPPESVHIADEAIVNDAAMRSNRELGGNGQVSNPHRPTTNESPLIATRSQGPEHNSADGDAATAQDADMASQMRTMVERMREFQAADPSKFARVWQEVKKAPHESSPPQPLPGPLAESSTVLPSQQVPGLFTNDRPQPEHSDALGVVSKDVSSPPGPKDDHKKNLFPGLQRPILAAAAAKILRAVPENAGKTIRPHDILTVLDENTSYVGLCEVLEAKGFLLNRVYFARALVLAINKERAQKSSTVTADMPTASVASASASTSGSRRQGQTSGDTISRTHPSFPETRQTTRLTASSHQAGTGQLAFVSSTKGGGEPGSASQAALQVSPISGSHQGVSLGQKGPSRGSVPAHHILSSQQATPFPAKPRVEERDAASGSEKARKRSHAEVIEIDDSGSEPESVRSAEAVKPKDASQETKRAAMTSSGLSRGHGKHANVEAVAPARPDPQVARSGSTQVPLASRLRNEAFVSPMKFKDATRRSDFNTRTIARDVLLATGRHPTLSSLNDHLTVATKNLPQMSPTWDLSTFRWDLVDPGGPPSQTSLPAAHGADKSNHTDTARSDHFSQFVYSPRKTPDLAQLPPQMDGASSFDSRSGTHGHARKNVVSGRPAALTSKASDKTSRVRASNSPTARQAASHDQVLPNPSRKRSREPEPEIDSRRSPRMSKLASGSPDPEPGQVLPIHTVSFAKPSHLLPDHHAPLRRFARSVPTNSSRTRASARVAQSKARKATAGGTWARSHTLSGKLEVVIPTRPPSMGRETLLQRWKNARQATDIYSTETREDQRLPLHAYKCRWENCSAELHNVTLLRMHMRKVHAEEMSEGTFTCLWADCRRTALTTLSGDAHGQTQRRDPLFFPTRGHWFQHVNSEHLEPYATKYGDGPLAHPVYCVPEIFTTEGEGVRDELSHPSPRVVQGRPKLHASTTRAPRIVASAPDTHDDDGLKSGVVEDIGSGTPPQAQAWEAVDSVAPSLPLPARRLISRLRARGALGGGLPVAVDSDGSVLIIEDVAS